MKSIVFYKSETSVRPIPDGEKDDAEENVFEQFGQSSKNKFKFLQQKQKTTGNFSATDYLTTRNESQKHGEKGRKISSFVPGWKDTGLDGRDGFSVCLDLKHFRGVNS